MYDGIFNNNTALNKRIRYLDACTVHFCNINCAFVGYNKTKTYTLFLINLSISHSTDALSMCTETCRPFHLFAVTVVWALRYVYSGSSGEINEARSRGAAHLFASLSTLVPFISDTIMAEL